jgi:hypothetical protein
MYFILNTVVIYSSSYLIYIQPQQAKSIQKKETIQNIKYYVAYLLSQ